MEKQQQLQPSDASNGESIRDCFIEELPYEKKPIAFFIRRACHQSHLGANYKPAKEDAEIFANSLMQLSVEFIDSLPVDEITDAQRSVVISEVAAMRSYLAGKSPEALAALYPNLPKIDQHNAVPDMISKHAKLWKYLLPVGANPEFTTVSPELYKMTFVDENEKVQPLLCEGYSDIHSTLLDLIEAKAINPNTAQHLALAFGTVKAVHILPSRRYDLVSKTMEQLKMKTAVVHKVPINQRAELEMGRRYLGMITQDYPVGGFLTPAEWLAGLMNSDEELKTVVAAHIESHVSFALAMIMRND